MDSMTLTNLGAALIWLASVLTAYIVLKKQLIAMLNKQVRPIVDEAISEALKPLSPVTDGTFALLSYRLEREAEKVLEVGAITESRREALIDLALPYLAAGRNGHIKDKYDRALRLPIVSEREWGAKRERQWCELIHGTCREDDKHDKI